MDSMTNDSFERCDNEPLISSLYIDFDSEDEAVKSDTSAFSWLEYFSFFTIGLSMMWSWYVRCLQFPIGKVEFLTLKIGQ
jgi:hypothetical protein